MKKQTIAVAAISLVGIICANAQEPKNLFPEGNFEGEIEMLSPHPNPDNLQKQEGVLYVEPGDYKNKGCSVSIENEQGSKFIRYKTPEAFTGILRTYIALDLPEPTPASITVSMRWRTSDLQKQGGAPEWASAQNDPLFVMEDGTSKTLFGTLRLTESTLGEWVEVEKTVTVPAGSKRLILQPGLYCMNGTLDVDDIKVFAE